MGGGETTGPFRAHELTRSRTLLRLATILGLRPPKPPPLIRLSRQGYNDSLLSHRSGGGHDRLGCGSCLSGGRGNRRSGRGVDGMEMSKVGVDELPVRRMRPDVRGGRSPVSSWPRSM